MIKTSQIKTALFSVMLIFGITGISSCGSSGSATPSDTSTVITPPVVSTPIEPTARYPDYNSSPLPDDSSGMESNAQQLAANMTLGWNIGNTLEAIGSETAWGNPLISRDLIQLVKDSGFNAIRIPTSWDQYSDQETAEIEVTWLNRVKEVVQYCVDNNLYVILNIHWDGGWLENNITTEKQQENNAKQKAFWQQIATHLEEFDEHLIFASANEPHVEDAEQMAVLLSYHQTFVDTVRATGGKNSNRVLVVQGPKTDIELTDQLWGDMPNDSVTDRLMMEVHFYTPYQFTLMNKDESWGNQFFYWGKDYQSVDDTQRNTNYGEEAAVDLLFKSMKEKFVDKGIPVILGEYSAVRRNGQLTGEALNLHLASRAYYHEYVTQQAIMNGLVPFYWDSGGLDTFAAGIFDRSDLTVFDQQTLDALLKGAITP
ncbi:MAG: glycoside hydrolase family 5 protein [Paraglaciecola sp.]|uniref:glycoside hydrolase family 5 protein n=1 Tax=Paraglaciecola sp. TaxID=1920173 RepID=UPI00329A6214